MTDEDDGAQGSPVASAAGQLLTRLLVPLLTASAPSRVVNVGSLGQVPFDPADAGFEHGYNGTDAYRRSKLALE